MTTTSAADADKKYFVSDTPPSIHVGLHNRIGVKFGYLVSDTPSIYLSFSSVRLNFCFY